MLHCSVIINSVRSTTADFHLEWNLINDYMKIHVGLPPNLCLLGGLYSVRLMKAKTVVQNEIWSVLILVVLCHVITTLKTEAVCSSETWIPISKLHALVTENNTNLQQ